MQSHKLKECLRPLSRAESNKILMSVSSMLFEAVDSPKSLAAYIMLKHGEYDQLVTMDINPDDYRDAKAFADDYLAVKFLSKYPKFSHEKLDPKAAAKRSFFEYEDMCRITNLKFRALDADPSLWDPTMHQVFWLARRKIRQVLRDPDLESIAHAFGWGPGATTAASGSYTSAYIKFAKRLDVTSNCLVLGRCCVNSIPSWVNCQLQTDDFPSVEASITMDAFNIVRGNEIVFVPKNAKTHRIIAKEPHVNSYVQKGFGAEIRKLLRIAAGINLKDQGANQRLAKEGSITGALSTIDLSGASDTISQELVKLLLPEKWYSLLDQIRSKQGFIREDKTWIHYHKFSSMGNGCTFELESLIFWALCKACLEVNGGEQTISVYGDDIIVPSEHYESVAKVIDFAGFRINASKSFSQGPFRESCGKDYYLGTDVRPIFLKENISNAEAIFRLSNAVRRYAHSRNQDSSLEGAEGLAVGCDCRFHAVWNSLVAHIPMPLRDLKITEGFGDGGLVVNFDEATPSLAKSLQDRGWGGYSMKCITRHPVKQVMRDRHAGYAATLSGLEPQPDWLDSALRELGLNPRDWRVVRSDDSEKVPLLGHHDLRAMTFPKITRIHTHGWYDFGPWRNSKTPR